MVTTPEHSGSPPKRAPPPVPEFTPPPVFTPAPLVAAAPVLSPPADFASSPDVSNVSKSQSFDSTQVHELTVDDIEDFEEDDDIDEVDSLMLARRTRNDATELALGLPSFATGILRSRLALQHIMIFFSYGEYCSVGGRGNLKRIATLQLFVFMNCDLNLYLFG